MTNLLAQEVEILVRELVAMDGDLTSLTIQKAWKISVERVLKRLELGVAHRQACEPIFESILTIWNQIWLPAHGNDEIVYTFAGRESLKIWAICELQRDTLLRITKSISLVPYPDEKQLKWASNQLMLISQELMDDRRIISQACKSGGVVVKGKYFEHLAYRLCYMLGIVLGSEARGQFFNQHSVIAGVLDQFVLLMKVGTGAKLN